MSGIFKDLEKEIMILKTKESTLLAEHEIETTDGFLDKDFAVLWLKEAEKRYESYQKGERSVKTDEEVMSKSSMRLK